MNEKTITISVNGVCMTRTIEARTLLSDFLRQDLCLTGTHVGCEHGVPAPSFSMEGARAPV